MNYDLNMVIGSNGNNNISSILNNSDSNSSTSTIAGSSGNSHEAKKSDIKESKQPFPFGMCKVCGDQATGVHYGIATCEGCKVSFSVYIKKNIRLSYHLNLIGIFLFILLK
jgi:hypothetical protein